MNIYRERMLNVVRAVEEGRADEFDMSRWGTGCNTPACVLGHYAARTDLQQVLTLQYGLVYSTGNELTGRQDVERQVVAHFGISELEMDELFGSRGCDDAFSDRPRALAYLRGFIERKWPIEEPEPVMVGERVKAELVEA